MSKLTLLGKGFGLIKRIGSNSPVKVAGNMGVLYGGWKYLVKPELGDAMEEMKKGSGVVGEVSKVVVGEGRAEKMKNIVDGTLDKVDNAVNPTNAAGGSASTSAGASQSMMEQSVGNTLNGLFGGGMNMFTNFFNNLFSGNISLLGVLGLILGGWLLMGRHGLWAKIAGGIIGLATIYNNSQRQQSQQQVNVSNTPEASRGMHR